MTPLAVIPSEVEGSALRCEGTTSRSLVPCNSDSTSFPLLAPSPHPSPAMFLQDRSVNFGDRLQASFSTVFGELVPALLGALVILFAGYLLAKVLEKLTERFLRRIRLNR